LNESWRDRTLIIGATNLIEHIDPAVLRPGGFDRKIFIGPPDLEARTEMLRIHMRDRPQDKIDWVTVADKCEYYTNAEIENIVNEAARIALQDRRPIRDTDLSQAISENPPTLSYEKVEKMRSRIGFV
jgi:transitional endoplasmic reticulum ATPase